MLPCFACFLFSHPLFRTVLCSTHWIIIPGQKIPPHIHGHCTFMSNMTLSSLSHSTHHNTGLQLLPAQHTMYRYDHHTSLVATSPELAMGFLMLTVRRSSCIVGSFLCANRNDNAAECLYAYRWCLLRSRLASLAAALCFFSGLPSMLLCRVV